MRSSLSLEETARDGSSLYVASLAASEIEEADIVIPRLVEAVVSRMDGVGAVWLVSDGPFSPFVGGGAGVVGVDDLEGTGVHLEAGMEMLRLHRMRFSVAADVIIPGYDPRKDNRFTDAKRVYPSLQLRVGF